MITVSIKDLNENKKNMTDNKFIRLIQRRNKKLDSNWIVSGTFVSEGRGKRKDPWVSRESPLCLT